MVASILIIIGVIVLDQATKLLVDATMAVGDSFPLIKGLFNITYVRNPGAAMGILRNNRMVFLVFSILGIAAVIFYLFRYKPQNKWISTSLAMIAGGGLGNMIDRLFYGESFGNGTVIDFIDFCAFPKLWMWIFNVADAFVCVGAGILFVVLLLDIIKESKEKPNA